MSNDKYAVFPTIGTTGPKTRPVSLSPVEQNKMMNLVVIGLIVVLASILLSRAYSGYLGAITMIVGLYLMSKGRNKMNQP
jgi:hypothetical protein